MPHAYVVCSYAYVRLYLGITQERIDECRGAKETAMLTDIQALVQSQADLNAPDDSGATVVSRRTGSARHTFPCTRLAM